MDDEQIKKMSEKLKKMRALEEHGDGKKVNCPYCKKKTDFSDELEHDEDGFDDNVCCSHCGREYYLSITVDISWITRKKEEVIQEMTESGELEAAPQNDPNQVELL